ncbi:fungal-specific transcription factor domain-containing protein [Chaetomium strumarium]|uniref:Fungal-specific transcription factor domain-containing protein n=1 Tax=Chaetomium strumarium TaxID=1170767 RepID=A0AAJ0GVQ4_9PEZI|nr:fungal-specific transcription factor domain-containing protein [Chaetomium strumarium]
MSAPERIPPSPDLQPSKRARQSSPDKDSPTSLPSAGATTPTGEHLHEGLLLGHSGTSGAAGRIGQSSSFRNVSACNRCRLRKNRCDQRLPSCASCEKASVACVGYDPITKREIPRSYIFYLEKRVEQLEGLLTANNVAFPPAQNLDYCSKSGHGSSSSVRSPTEAGQSAYSEGTEGASGGGGETRRASRSGAYGDSGVSNNRYLGSTSGISFARVVFAALQSSVSDQKSNSDKGGVRPSKPAPSANGAAAGPGTSMRDSFFGLHTRPTIHPATFPDQALGLRLARLYFEHANPQIPILHKGEFMEMFERAYADEGRARGPRELYVLNMVFAIGAGIIVGDSKGEPTPADATDPPGSRQCQPEEYHASAILHLEACLGSGSSLKDLQAVLLLANFALLRPVPPGLWYIIGVAVRLAIDLGLHYEDGKDLESGLGDPPPPQKEAAAAAARERGRREYVRDLKRRLWWCTYSLDRLVSICVSRPFGVSDQVITTEFPSLLEDRYITPDGIVQPPQEMLRPTYKLVAHHYFRLRLLQSEILQVLQFRQAQSARASGQNVLNPYMHTDLPSPFLSKFDSFRSWRIDIDKRLWEWKNSAPEKHETGVAFSTEFLDLNYWQAVIMLYRQSLSVPTVFEGEYDPSREVNSPAVYNAELREDEDRVYLKVAEAGQRIMRLYRQLHVVGLVNHTYLTTHHLFVAGISYLYAIWHSPIVRSRLTMDEVDFTVLAATSVFRDFIDKCPPAEACRDAFERTVKATLRMVNASGGFGQQYQSGQLNNGSSSSRNSLDPSRLEWSSRSDSASMSGKPQHKRHRLPKSMDLTSAGASDVYSDSASLLSAVQLGAQYRLPGASAVKPEPDGLSLMRNLHDLARSNGSSADRNNPVTPEAQQQQSSPIASMASPTVAQQQQRQRQRQQQQQNLSPGSLSFSELQGMEFLQSLDPSAATNSSNNNNAGAATGTDGVDFSGLADIQMDLGFGLGWDGSDGQQLDLFDGFFFGGGIQPPQQRQQGSGDGGEGAFGQEDAGI